MPLHPIEKRFSWEANIFIEILYFYKVKINKFICKVYRVSSSVAKN